MIRTAEPNVAAPVQSTLEGVPPLAPRSIRHLLICLDRSPLSEACIPLSGYVAKALGAAVTLLHVMASPKNAQKPPRADALGWKIARREAEQYLARMQSTLQEEVGATTTLPVNAELTQGRPAERIVSSAQELSADLIVLASHGEGGPGAGNLGGTAQQVLSLAPESLLVVPSTSTGANLQTPPRRILVPLDGSLRTESVLPSVVHLARAWKAELVLAHVVADPTPTAMLSRADDLAAAHALASRMQAGADRYLAQLRQRLLRDIPHVQTVVVRHIDQRQALLNIAEDKHADLLVLSAHGAACNPERPFGSVTAYVLAHARIPSLVLQDLPSGSHHRTSPDLEADTEDSSGVCSSRASWRPGSSESN